MINQYSFEYSSDRLLKDEVLCGVYNLITLNKVFTHFKTLQLVLEGEGAGVL